MVTGAIRSTEVRGAGIAIIAHHIVHAVSAFSTIAFIYNAEIFRAIPYPVTTNISFTICLIGIAGANSIGVHWHTIAVHIPETGGIGHTINFCEIGTFLTVITGAIRQELMVTCAIRTTEVRCAGITIIAHHIVHAGATGGIGLMDTLPGNRITVINGTGVIVVTLHIIRAEISTAVRQELMVTCAIRTTEVRGAGIAVIAHHIIHTGATGRIRFMDTLTGNWIAVI